MERSNFGNVAARMYTNERHVLLFLRGRGDAFMTSMEALPGWLEIANPDMVASVKEVHYTADSLTNELNVEAVSQLGEEQATWSVSFRSTATTNKMAIMLTQATLLIRDCLAEFIMSEEQLAAFPRVIRSNVTYVALDTPDEVKLFVMERPISPAEKAYPMLIKLRLQEMTQHVSSVALPQDLALVPFHATKNGSSLFHTVGRKEFFPLCQQLRLEELNIRLLDEEDRPLRVLSGGQPTFVKLRLVREKMDSREHILRLSSHESLDVYGSNTASDFKVRLKDKLLPTDDVADWEVALSSIYHPTEIDYDKMADEENSTIEVLVGDNYMILTLVSSQKVEDMTLTGLINSVNRRMTTRKMFTETEGELAVSFSEVTPGELQVEFMTDAVVGIGGLLQYLLGTAKTTAAAPLVVRGERGTKVKLGHYDFTRIHPNILLLETDFVGQTVFGNKWSNVLQMIRFPPLSSTTEGVKSVSSRYEVQHLDFHPVSQTDLNLLSFKLKNAEGRLVSFFHPNTPVYVTLLFRKRNTCY